MSSSLPSAFPSVMTGTSSKIKVSTQVFDMNYRSRSQVGGPQSVPLTDISHTWEAVAVENIIFISIQGDDGHY